MISLHDAIQAIRRDGDGQYNVQCPAHDDHRPSLSVERGRNGGIILKCHAGCDTKTVLDNAGLTWADVMPEDVKPANVVPTRTIVETYDYRDEHGKLLYQVVRFEPKDFRQRTPNGTGWSWKLGDVRRVLYRLPDLIAGGKEVYIAEGEKDVDNLRGLGLDATCNAGGAGKWREEYTQQLIDAGIEDVKILTDNDDPGRDHAKTVARSCHAAGLTAKVVQLPGLPVKGDVSDWLRGHHSPDELFEAVKAAPLFMPSNSPATVEQGEQHRDEPGANDEGSQVEPPWEERLQKGDNGRPIPNALNVSIALEHAPALSGIVESDTFAGKLMLNMAPPWENVLDFHARPWKDTDDAELLFWLQERGIPLRGVQTVADTVRAVAARHSYDPLKDYLLGLRWDRIDRLSNWLPTYLGAEQTELNQAIGRAFLISAVARGLWPGCQVDHVLVLEGEQGIRKSDVVRILGDKWALQNLPDMHSKDGMITLAGSWFIEIAELAAISRSEIESVKSFITRTVDRYRPAYGRHVIEQSRRCVFVGTTNDRHYLRDTTGNRRFWPVDCGAIDKDTLARDRDQLFAEAVDAYHQGEAWHLTDEKLIKDVSAAQALRVEHDPWMPAVSEIVKGKAEITTREILQKLGVSLDKCAAPQGKRVAGIMRRLGFNSRRIQSTSAEDIVWSRTEQ